jgi:hypothetical protein
MAMLQSNSTTMSLRAWFGVSKFSPTRHSTEADRPISRVRDIVDALAKATIEAIPRDPYAARGFPGRHPP